MTDDQKADLIRIYGEDSVIITKNIVWENIEHVKYVAGTHDVLIGVFPQYLATAIGYEAGMAKMAGILKGQIRTKSGQIYDDELANEAVWTDKIIMAESAPAFAEDGTTRIFKHVCFKNIHGEIL